MGWDDVAAAALRLPGVERSTAYGRAAVKVRGKLLAAGGREEDHFVLRATLDEIEVLIETDPAAFYQTDHYKGWPAVLVRYAAADPERIAALIDREWARRASRAQLAARGDGLTKTRPDAI